MHAHAYLHTYMLITYKQMLYDGVVLIGSFCLVEFPYFDRLKCGSKKVLQILAEHIFLSLLLFNPNRKNGKSIYT